MPADLYPLFNPKSIAVIGASRSKEKVGGIVLTNILESNFKGKVYPVNPEAGEINGLTTYPDFAHLPETPDLAVLAVPAPAVNGVLKEIAQKGTKNVVVFSAGFKESGPDGEKLESELLNLSTQSGLNLLGPNCLGFVNNFLPLNLTFARTNKAIGNLRFVSQSGAIASSIFDWCQQNGLGFSDFVTLGNKPVLTENDILAYWQSEQYKSTFYLPPEGISRTRPTGLYLESITDGRKFLDLTRTISKTDPIFILKPGKTKAAAKAMQSHTGAIAGEDSVLETALNQAGIVRCEGLEDFFDFAKAFAWENPPAGPNVAVISNAGGPAVIIADAIEASGLTIAEFDDQTKWHLLEELPRTASIINPVDVLGDALAQRYADAMETVLTQPTVNALVVILTPQIMTQIEKTAGVIVQASQKYQKPIFCSFIGGRQVAQGEAILNAHRIPSFRYPERAVRVLAAMWRWQQWRQITTSSAPTLPPTEIPGIKEVLSVAKTQNHQALSFEEANHLMEISGITVPSSQKVESLESAQSFAQTTGWPIVLKLSSPAIVHKTEVKGVLTNITTPEILESSWNNLNQTKNSLEQQGQSAISVIVQKQITNGQELIVGVKRDPTFGPVLLFGAGGLYAEILSDHHLHLLPATTEEITNLIKSSKIYPLLTGYRGRPPLAIDKLTELITRLSVLALSSQEISEIEINPVILTDSAAVAVDSRIIIPAPVATGTPEK